MERLGSCIDLPAAPRPAVYSSQQGRLRIPLEQFAPELAFVQSIATRDQLTSVISGDMSSCAQLIAPFFCVLQSQKKEKSMSTKKDSIVYPRMSRLFTFCPLAALILVLTPAPANAQKHFKSKADFCSHLGKTIQASSGVQMYCFGPQRNGPAEPLLSAFAKPHPKGFANVDVANRAEDRTGSGAYVGGQSETSIAASGKYVVEAWNDATGFFNDCGAPMFKEELTGYAFSSDGGKTFTDYGGLPNESCAAGTRWFGDPSVGVFTNSGFTYFYISSLYACSAAVGCPNGGLVVAVSACQVTENTLSCGQPTIAATSNCNLQNGCGGKFTFLDKDYLVIDRAKKRLYITFTDFNAVPASAGQIEMAACDLDNPLAPVCQNGTTFARPYVNVQPGDSTNFCEYEGAYPALNRSTGDVYVGFEYNWATNVFGSSTCVNSIPTEVIVAKVPASCLPDPDSGMISPCSPPFLENSNIIVSTDLTVVPGYNRFLMNDYPRIAVSEAYKSVSLVWNDARDKPLGDILLQSFSLGDLSPVQSSPVRLNRDNGAGDMHTMPGLKNTSSTGLLNVTWYDRRGSNADTGKTDIFGVINVNPRTPNTPTNYRFSNVSSDWLATSSAIVPNFGDYTDNFLSDLNVLYVAWSDGRTGVPQPEEAHVKVQ
jgi:hypothetical protein